MPVLLSPDQAPSLKALLQQANTLGLDYTLASPAAGSVRVQGLASLSAAGAAEISFLANPRLHEQLASTRAAAVILTRQAYEALPPDASSFHAVLCDSPYAMYALLAQWFESQRVKALPAGIHPSALIDPSAHIGEGASIGPYCVIDAQAHVGAGARLGAHCVLGRGAILGKDCLLHARVTLYHGVVVGDRAILHSGVVLGADGFGFAPHPQDDAGAWVKIAQLGGLALGNDVEIGANTTVDRGALDNTCIGHGVKLDNQIMIGHNVQIGDHTAMAACVGVAGSTRIGRRCTIGGAAMISGHLVLADDVHVSGGTAITSSISQGGRYTGVFPYAAHREWQRNAAVLTQLSELRRRVRQLEGVQPHAANDADGPRS